MYELISIKPVLLLWILNDCAICMHLAGKYIRRWDPPLNQSTKNAIKMFLVLINIFAESTMMSHKKTPLVLALIWACEQGLNISTSCLTVNLHHLVFEQHGNILYKLVCTVTALYVQQL